MIEVYTDGACLGNPGPGGWAWAVVPEGEPHDSGGEPLTTNQRMELTAVLAALRALGVGSEAGPVVVVSDSTYVINCFRDKWWKKWQQNGWRNSKRQPVANADLWQPLVELVNSGSVTFRWVKGHGGDPWNDLEEVYGRLVTQWGNEMSHVVKVIGGVESQQTHIGQQGPRFKVVPRARQVAALQFLVNSAFATPEFMIQPEILRRIQPVGVVERIRAAHAAILGALLQSQRLDRMTEQATLEPTLAYPPLQLLTDLRTGVWSELARPGTSISIYRRNLQRAYLDTMDQRLNGPGNSAEVRALAKGELRALDQQLERALTGTGMDENTRRHLSDARDEIKTILDPRVPRTAPEPAAGGGRGGRGGLGSAGGPVGLGSAGGPVGLGSAGGPGL